MASFFERNHGNSVLKQQQQTASLECYVCFLKAITSSCKSEYLSSKKSSGQTNKCFWYSFHFLGSSTNPPFFLILNPGTRSFSENAKGSQSQSTTSPLWASHHGKYERKAILTGNWKDPQRNTHYAETFSPPLKTELTVTLINQWHLLQLAHCAQLCSNQSHSGWMSTFQAGRGTAARALSAVIYWRHLGKGSLIHLYNMLAFQVLVIKHQRELGGSFTPVTSETE